jgi:sugar phosphate isomerase/epimerase
MENDSIVITAKLNVDASEALIQKDLETLEGRLKSSPLKISCVINENSISQMQSQLNSLTNNLTINLGNANVENAKVEIIPDIKKGVLEQQAKQLQQELGLLFPYGETEKLREELKGYLNEYQKAYQAENGYGEQAQAHMEKIVDFANKYRQEMVLINETLKAEQDRIREIRKEQEKVFITAEQMAALNREAKQNGTTAQAMLNSVLPNGWYSNINKLPAGQMPYYWSQFATEVNSINPFREITNEGDIVQGIRDLAEFMSKSFTSVDNTIEKNRAVWEQWADTVRGSVGSITGQNPFADFFSEFVDISGETQTIANNMETVQDRIVQTVSVIQQSLGGNDGLSNVRFPINTQAIETFINELDQLNVQGVNIDQLRERLQSLGVTITSISPKFSQVGRAGEQVLNTLTIKGIDSANNIVTYIENFNKKTGAFEESSTKVEQSFAKIRQEEERVKSESEAAQKAMNDFLKLKGTFDVYSIKYGDNQSLVSNFEEINRLIQGFDNTAPIDKQRESIIRIDNELKVIKATIDDINRSASQTASNVERIYPNLTFTSGDSSSTILASAKEQLNAYFNAEGVENTASRVKRAVEDASGSLNKFFVQVEREDGAVETLTYALNQHANAYEYLGKITREADNSTDFRHVDISTQIELQTQKLEKFATDVGKSSEASGVLREDIANLRNELSQVGDTNAMKAFLDNFDIAKAKFQSLNSETKVVEASIKKLNQLLNNTQFRNNANNPAVSQQRADIEALRTEYEGLLRELSNANDPQSLQNINARLAELKPQFDAVVQSSNELNNSLKDNDASAKFSAKLNNLKNQVDIFANTNRRATESLRLMRDGQTTFAQGFQNIRDALNRGNLDATGLQRLREQFQNFRGEADAAGLTVSRFFQSMQSQLRMVLQRWISLYAVIGYIRKMIDNVKELDNAMINLRRVTDETDAGYQRFLEDANELARQMKTTTASLVEMSYQWSKLGFEMNEALELSKASTIFMRVADVGQDQALSNLVTSLKAFRLEASQTMDVVDKLDKLNNEYAVSAAGLGEGLERSASAMAMTGNSLEETLAMLTGAGEIVQNLENTGNALRVISLR